MEGFEHAPQCERLLPSPHPSLGEREFSAATLDTIQSRWRRRADGSPRARLRFSLRERAGVRGNMRIEVQKVYKIRIAPASFFSARPLIVLAKLE
jgi:hypothetical protein